MSSGGKSTSPGLKIHEGNAQNQVVNLSTSKYIEKIRTLNREIRFQDVVMDRHLSVNTSNHINLTGANIQSLREAVFRPQIPFKPVEIPLSVWEKNSAFLLPYTKDLTETEVRRWAPVKVGTL